LEEQTEHYFDWSDIVLWSIPDKKMQGRSIQTLSHLWERDPKDVAMDILCEHGATFTGLFFGKAEKDLRTAALWKYAAVGSDGFYSSNPAASHPRSYGTFPRMIRKYVREQRAFSIEEAVYRMTGLPASILRIDDRGRLTEGAGADILILDPDTCSDTATYENPAQAAAGIPYVIANGTIVRSNGSDHHGRAGSALRYTGRK
jgi:N-acyl-D-amino-acid deacylase